MLTLTALTRITAPALPAELVGYNNLLLSLGTADQILSNMNSRTKYLIDPLTHTYSNYAVYIYEY